MMTAQPQEIIPPHRCNPFANHHEYGLTHNSRRTFESTVHLQPEFRKQPAQSHPAHPRARIHRPSWLGRNRGVDHPPPPCDRAGPAGSGRRLRAGGRHRRRWHDERGGHRARRHPRHFRPDSLVPWAMALAATSASLSSSNANPDGTPREPRAEASRLETGVTGACA